MCADWRRTAWVVDFADVSEFLNKLERIPNQSEKIINRVLETKGAPRAMTTIQPTIPISSWKGRVLNKKHAVKSKALTAEYRNLEFTIRPKPQFNYIKYPDLGIGTSIRNEPQMFMKKGLDKAAPLIVKDMEEAVISEINKTLGE